MFKKQDFSQISIETTVKFFNSVSNQSVFKDNEINNKWLWQKLQFILDYISSNSQETITVSQLKDLIYAESHKTFFTENNSNEVKVNFKSLDFLISENPILTGLPSVLYSNWNTYSRSLIQKENKKHFSKKHIFSILNLSLISLIIIGTVYSWKMFGFFGGLLLSSYLAYHFGKKTIASLKNKKEQQLIQTQVAELDNNKDETLLKPIRNLGLEPWTRHEEINIELMKLKNKSIRFISLYLKNEKNRHPSMLLDFEKIWINHIPFFIRSILDNNNEENKKTIIKTIHSMSNVIEGHIESLFWDENIEISAKQRYWLTKEAEKNI